MAFQFSRELRGLDVTLSEFTVSKVSNSLENWKGYKVLSNREVYLKGGFRLPKQVFGIEV